MLIPKKGSGRIFAATCAPTTVDGTAAASQPSALYSALEIAAPPSGAFACDWICQPSCRTCTSCARPSDAADNATSATPMPRDRTSALFVNPTAIFPLKCCARSAASALRPALVRCISRRHVHFDADLRSQPLVVETRVG